MACAPASLVAVPTTLPARRELHRDRAADAARSPGHQRHLSDELLLAHASIPFTSASVAGSRTVADTASASMRLTMPASTLPGPHSMT